MCVCVLCVCGVCVCVCGVCVWGVGGYMTQYLSVVVSDVMNDFSNAGSRQDKIFGCNGGHQLGSPDIRAERVSQREAV